MKYYHHFSTAARAGRLSTAARAGRRPPGLAVDRRRHYLDQSLNLDQSSVQLQPEMLVPGLGSFRACSGKRSAAMVGNGESLIGVPT